MRIDTLVRKYPRYTHDDIFYLEYDFAMMLLMINKDDIDSARRYDKAANRVRTNNNKKKRQ